MKSLALALAVTAATLATACESATPDRTAAVSTDAHLVTPKISWPSPAVRDERAFASLGDRERASELVERAPVPVLAPTNVALEQPTFIVGPEFYALTGRVDGATISIHGKRAAHRYEGIEPVKGNRTLRGVPGFVSENEGIRTTSWIENGAAYSLDVECADPTEARCASDAFAVELVENLKFAGGGAR